jgi:hypothetical protein
MYERSLLIASHPFNEVSKVNLAIIGALGPANVVTSGSLILVIVLAR